MSALNIESKVAPEEVCVCVYIEGVKRKEGGRGRFPNGPFTAGKQRENSRLSSQRLLQLFPNRGVLVCEFGQAALFIFKS